MGEIEPLSYWQRDVQVFLPCESARAPRYLWGVFDRPPPGAWLPGRGWGGGRVGSILLSPLFPSCFILRFLPKLLQCGAHSPSPSSLRHTPEATGSWDSEKGLGQGQVVGSLQPVPSSPSGLPSSGTVALLPMTPT